MKRIIYYCLFPIIAGCTDAPRECGGQSLEALRAQIKTPYEVIYTTDLPRGTFGRTIKLDKDGPAIVFVASDANRITRDGALSHELACHVLGNVSHPIKPPPSNLAKPDRGAQWDRMKMGAPQ
jgi:hypothetical protein